MISIRYTITAYVREGFCAMVHIISPSSDFGWLHDWNYQPSRLPIEMVDTLYPLQGRIFPSRASLLALLAHRAYYVPAHCGVTWCSCFVILLPLPSISITSEIRVHVFLLGFTPLNYYISICLRCFIHFSFQGMFITCTNTLVNVYFICTSQGVRYTSRVWYNYQQRSLPLQFST